MHYNVIYQLLSSLRAYGRIIVNYAMLLLYYILLFVRGSGLMSERGGREPLRNKQLYGRG